MRFLSVDLAAALVAFLWALSALYVTKIAVLCSPEVAFAFALAAATRGVAKVRNELESSTNG